MESGLTLKKVDFEIKVSRYAGYPIGEANGGDRDPTAKQSSIVTDCVESGLRRFYFCGYKWSFLRPIATLSLASGASAVVLPDDFGGVEGRISVSDTSDGIFNPVNFMNPMLVEQMYSESPDATGRPQVASMRAIKGTDRQKGQRNELYIFPIADARYVLKFQYYLLAGLPDVTHPFPYGGAEHSETILLSCLAVHEERYDNVMNGPQAMAFARQLSASQAMDNRKKEQVIGYNADNSDRFGSSIAFNYPAALYNGVDFSDD